MINNKIESIDCSKRIVISGLRQKKIWTKFSNFMSKYDINKLYYIYKIISFYYLL